MRAVVYGGGLFGCVAAMELRKLGMEVSIIEPNTIMGGASSRNHNRLHQGYHYPRSLETARQSRDSVEEFMKYFPGIVQHGAPHHYAIAAEGSLTSPAQFEEFCEPLELPLTKGLAPRVFREERLAACYLTYEPWIDTRALRWKVWRMVVMQKIKINNLLHTERPLEADVIVNAAYAGINEVNALYGREPLPYVTEDVVMSRFLLPHSPPFAATILDGPFCSIMPDSMGAFLGYHVEKSVSQTNSPLYDIHEWFNLEGAEEIGLIRVKRAVLENPEDARPTLVERDGDFWTVFSGKLSTCVSAAKEIASFYR